jgi:hypothetical protein
MCGTGRGAPHLVKPFHYLPKEHAAVALAHLLKRPALGLLLKQRQAGAQERTPERRRGVCKYLMPPVNAPERLALEHLILPQVPCGHVPAILSGLPLELLGAASVKNIKPFIGRPFAEEFLKQRVVKPLLPASEDLFPVIGNRYYGLEYLQDVSLQLCNLNALLKVPDCGGDYVFNVHCAEFAVAVDEPLEHPRHSRGGHPHVEDLLGVPELELNRHQLLFLAFGRSFSRGVHEKVIEGIGGRLGPARKEEAPATEAREVRF